MSGISYLLISIGGVLTGLLGVEELFAELYKSGMKPDDENIGAQIIKVLKKHNFIPKPAVDDYQKDLIREYSNYYHDRLGGEALEAKDYGTWEGYPREYIPWFPTVSEELCNACWKCLEVCPKNVFEVKTNGKVVVVEPFLCIVGCCFCKSVCNPRAILLPQHEMLDQYRLRKI